VRLEFVNHASYILDAPKQGVRLLTDPWLEGTAFNNGWALLSKTSLRPEDLGTVTHLWFSHEHPDHFSPPNLKKIPESARRNITVLFQQTGDRKVVDFCSKLGFKAVSELPPDRFVPLAPGFEVMCNPTAGYEDSWMFARTPEASVLNMNDCWIIERQPLEAIKHKVGKVDLLATQFSVSAWDGNADETERLRAGARAMLDKALTQCEVFAPRWVLPFASFIWFCHEENAYMNQAFMGIDDVELAFRTRAEPVMMYPGDAWTIGDAHDNGPALARYRADQQSLPDRPRMKAAVVPLDTLIESSRSFCRALIDGSDRSRVKARWAAQSFRRGAGRPLPDRLVDLVTLRAAPASIWLTDHQAAYTFDPEHGLAPAALAKDQCDVHLGSESLHFAFKFLWGGQTLSINGRFQERARDSRKVLFDYFDMAGSRNAGRVVTWRSLPADLGRRVAGVARFAGADRLAAWLNG
jgi:hypothetical protein